MTNLWSPKIMGQKLGFHCIFEGHCFDYTITTWDESLGYAYYVPTFPREPNYTYTTLNLPRSCNTLPRQLSLPGQISEPLPYTVVSHKDAPVRSQSYVVKCYAYPTYSLKSKYVMYLAKYLIVWWTRSDIICCKNIIYIPTNYKTSHCTASIHFTRYILQH